MKTEFNKVIDFLETQQQEDKLNTNQLHLIVQTLTTFLDDEQLQEVENLFNQFKNKTMKKLIDYFTPTTEEHKSFLRHFLGTLTAFIVFGGIFYCLMYLKAL